MRCCSATLVFCSTSHSSFLLLRLPYSIEQKLDPTLDVTAALTLGSDAAGCVAFDSIVASREDSSIRKTLFNDIVTSVRRTNGVVIGGNEACASSTFATRVGALHERRRARELARAATQSEGQLAPPTAVSIALMHDGKGDGVTLVTAGGSGGNSAAQVVRLAPRGAAAEAVDELRRNDARATELAYRELEEAVALLDESGL